MSKLYDLLSAMCGKIKKPDWNQNDSTAPDYVKNRPFYQDTVFDITWDGNTEGLDAVEGIPFYKVSGTAPEKNDISGSEIVIENDGVQEVHKADGIDHVEGENCVLIGEFAAIVYAENATFDRLIFPTPGVWFLSVGTQFTRSLKKTITKTLDSVYLPKIPAEKLPEIPATKLPIISFVMVSSTGSTATCNTTYNDAVNLAMNGNIRAFLTDNTKYYYCVSVSKGKHTAYGGDCLIFKFVMESFETANKFKTETRYAILQKNNHVTVIW